MKSEFQLKYRPSCLEEVVGQEVTVKSLRSLFKDKKIPHSICFSGPSGTGKTTLARVVAKELGCCPTNIIEMDAATHTGVNDMRDLMEELKYSSLGAIPIKFVIMDECHMLSKSSWNSLLKIVEEPPEHCYFAFCTTEIQKVPKTIQTRCHSYALTGVSEDDLVDLLEYVVNEEDLQLPGKSLESIAFESEGSPRKALVYLSQILGCENISEVKSILRSASEEKGVIDLCRFLAEGRGVSWLKITSALKGLKDLEPESIRITMFCYFTQAALNTKSEDKAQRFLAFLEALCHPITTKSTGLGELLLSLAESAFPSES